MLQVLLTMRKMSPQNDQLWKKRSIFFNLPYWKHQLLRHNLDVMHIEKNVTEQLINTFLFFDKKGKDNKEAREDLVVLNIKQNLHPIRASNGKVTYPPALYSMTRDEKDLFLGVLKDLKVPDGYASNMSRCVSIKERKLKNMKSHDYHILMQDILPISLRASMRSDILQLVMQLSAFFKGVCAREIDIETIDHLQQSIILLLCQMEKIFPPGFFTIMVHLMIHLPSEIKLGGPTAYRWMYPVERSLGSFKSDVKNRSSPEACIAEGTIGKECLIYCSKYFGGIETIFNRARRNEDMVDNSHVYKFNTSGRSDGKARVVHIKDKKLLDQAHRYVLLQFDIIEDYRRRFVHLKRSLHGRGRVTRKAEGDWLVNEFSYWFSQEVLRLNEDINHHEELVPLARGPNNTVKKLKGFITRGYRFRTVAHDRTHSTQNSGVSVITKDNTRWYGKINDIYELDYFGAFKCVLFKCMWVDVRPYKGLKKDKHGFTMVNFAHLVHTGEQLKDDPFILSSEAEQVFYVSDGNDRNWCHAILTKPRDIFQTGHNVSTTEEEDETHLDIVPEAIETNGFDDMTNLCRNDIDFEDMIDIQDVDLVGNTE